MLGLVAAFSLLGYTLVYAAVANGGRFAATPWEGLRASAYDGQSASSSAASGSSGGIIGAATGILKKLIPLPFLPLP